MTRLVILSAALASGLYGIEHRIEPEPLVEGNAYDHKFPEALALPRTLWEAAQRLKQSRMARECFGDAFVHWVPLTTESTTSTSVSVSGRGTSARSSLRRTTRRNARSPSR